MIHRFRGRYLLAAIVLVLDLPILAVLAVASVAGRLIAGCGRLVARPFRS